MLKTTNLIAVKEIAISFLYMDFAVNENFDFLVDHPIFETVFFPIKKCDNLSYVDLRDNEGLMAAREEIKSIICQCKEYMQFLHIIRKNYLPAFFKFTEKYLSKKDFSCFLGEMWTLVEFTNSDGNVSIQDFLKYFKMADVNFLMDEEERDTFNKLSDEIIIYRGVKPDSAIRALSWSTKKSVAKWFANRFEENGSVYRAKIKKENVLAFFNRRDEYEIIVDYDKLYDVGV